MTRDLLSLLDLDADRIKKILMRAMFLKKARQQRRQPQTLRGRNLAMIFEKPSTRTKVTFELAIKEMGGESVYLDSFSSQLGRGETYGDTGRVLSRYVHGIVMRTHGQKNLETLAEAASVPVINALSDLYHPCQILTDIMTIQEEKTKIGKCRGSYVGDGNNIANTWITAAIVLGFELRIATPKGYEPSAMILQKIGMGKSIRLTHDPAEAVAQADVINTDTWFSMGQELTEDKRKAFEPYQVNQRLLQRAKKDAIVLHCLPAHRGEEITNDVMDGPQSRVWDQAENRLHVQKAILEMYLSGPK